MKSSPFLYFAAAVFFVVALFLAAYFYPSGLNWGFHFLGFLPGYCTLLFMSLLLGFFVYIYRGEVERHVAECSVFMDRHPGRFLFVSLLVFAGFAFAFHEKASLLGDSYTIIKNYQDFDMGIAPLAPWHEPFSMFFYYFATHFFDELIFHHIETSFFAVDLLLGIGFVICSFFILRELFVSPAERFLMFILMVGFPYMVFFYGYIEIYGFSLLMLSLFVLCSMKVIQKKIPFYFLPPLYVIVTFSHYVSGLLIFSSGYIAYLEYRRGRSRHVVIGSGIAAGLVFIIFLLAHFDATALIDQSPISHQLSLTQATSLIGTYTEAYTIFSVHHVGDILNYVILMSPLPLVVLVVMAAKHRSALIMHSSNTWFLAAFAPIFIYYCVANLEQGNSDDWDVFASYFILLNLFAGLVFFQLVKNQPVRVFSFIVGCSLILSMPWFTLNASREATIRRFQTMWDSRNVSHMGQYTMALRLTRYYDAVNDSVAQSDVWQYYRKLFPEDPRGYENEIASLNALRPQDSPRKAKIYEGWLAIDPRNADLKQLFAAECLKAGIKLYSEGKSEQSAQFYGLALVNDSTLSHAYNNLGVIYAESGRLQLAVSHFKKAIQFDSVYAEAYYNLGLAFQDSGRKQEGLEMIRKAAELGYQNSRIPLKERR